jgi:hypothetical protein
LRRPLVGQQGLLQKAGQTAVGGNVNGWHHEEIDIAFQSIGIKPKGYQKLRWEAVFWRQIPVDFSPKQTTPNSNKARY